MAVVATVRKRGTTGDLQQRIVDLTLDNSYPTGGWPVTARQLGLGQNGAVWFVALPEANGYSFEWDYVLSQLKAFQNSAGTAPQAQLANLSAALNGVVIRAVFWGTGAG
jgi:hypothetical protein